jgi:tetratricopeptide (TPR) repeat protein
MDKRSVVANAGQAFTYAALEETDKAHLAFQQTIRLFPKEPNVHYAYGQFLRVRNSDQALEEFQKELEVSPEHLPARLQIAWHFLTRGESAKGIPYAQEALKLQSDSFSARYVLGRLYFDLNQTDRAIPELEAAVEAVPSSTEVRNFLAQALWKAGRKEEAQKQLDEVRRLRNLQMEAERGLVASGAEEDVKP